MTNRLLLGDWFQINSNWLVTSWWLLYDLGDKNSTSPLVITIEI